MDPIVILTGAGLSAESGLGTFRDPGGLWSQYRLEDVATPEGFARNPELVHQFYNARRANCMDAAPNDAHYALARLAKAHVDAVSIVTQNIDDLHERAGTPADAVLHMHGTLSKMRCAACGATWPATGASDAADPCPACGRQATRPDVVWFGEIPYDLDRIATLLDRAARFVAIGTSGSVYPAAAFVNDAASGGAATLELNLEASDIAGYFDAARQGPATQLVPAWVDEVLGGRA